jgi:oligopeptidase B
MKIRAVPSGKRALAVLIAISAVSALVSGQQAPQPPAAKKIRKELRIHGQTRVDDYYWLNERTNPKVIDYLKAENA